MKQLDVHGSNVLFNVNNQFTLGKGWSAELSGFYRTKGIEGQIYNYAAWPGICRYFETSVERKRQCACKHPGYILYQRRKGEINFQQTEAHFENTRDSRVAGISFSYRFGKPLKGPQNNRKKGGADDEQNRVKAAEITSRESIVWSQ